MEKDQLKFKALNKGLGFHPISDPAPYRPKAKGEDSRRPKMGSGAEIASPPKFIHPSYQSLRQPTLDYHPQSPAAPQTFQKTALQQATPQAAQHVSTIAQKRLVIEPAYGLAYSLRRFAAYTLDTMINVSLSALAFGFVLQQMNIPLKFDFVRSFILMGGLFFITFSWALVLAQEIAFETSLGKRIFRLQIQAKDSALFLRAFFLLVSISFFGLGIFWALLDRKKRCWHDIIVDAQPTELSE